MTTDVKLKEIIAAQEEIFIRRQPRSGELAGAKGCVVFAAEPVEDYRAYLDVDDRYSHAHRLYQHNGGVFLPPWGKSEQWLISVQHDEADIDRLVDNFGVFARAISAAADRHDPLPAWSCALYPNESTCY